ncbi:chromate efflux transporter [Roseibium marinum]|uniref:Chromate transporter n=1 Tax=Roseibium marinum TaxID=281252 RepID=A0A2S3US04_9HYPH|nr:chromate efflux transporter [Roseibium marinum]POF30508.1 chromate transporter [Roseibium marinum]
MTANETVNGDGVPSLAAATRVWARIGVLSFGGPAAQIALMHREVVEDRRWLSEQTFLNALSFCMLLPGPEAMQLATYAGWRMHGTVGGLVAGLLFVLPGAALMLLLAALYVTFGALPLVQALFLGVKAAVLVIVLEALLRISRRALTRPLHYWIAAGAFVALFVLDAPYPLVIAAAAAVGLVSGKGSGTGEVAQGRAAVSPWGTLRTVLVWLALWWCPLVLLEFVFPGQVLGEIGRFFSVLATVTFGGAYAVLAYMAQEAVSGFGWLSAAEMADALGLAETTPGPLILVTEFVGFLAAARAGTGEADLVMGVAGAVVTLWATFVPCFLWVFAGAPYIERLHAMPKLKSALDAITAAVVGVILNLSIWFALQVTFSDVFRLDFGPLRPLLPDVTSLDWRVPVLTLVAGLLVLRLRKGIPLTLTVCALLGLLLSRI